METKILFGVVCFSFYINFVHPQAFLPIVDHQEEITRFRRQHNDYNCTLPPHPENGRWTILNSEGVPGDQIPIGTILQFECNPNYKLSNTTYIVCDKEWNSVRIPECERTCPPIASSPTTTVNCIDKRGAAIHCTEATDGSRLTYDCVPFYETPFGYKKQILCVDGLWNFPKPVCQPVCGKKIDKDVLPLLTGGVVNKYLEYPWVTAIYKREGTKYTNICGGTLLSQRVVLTAAHCVSNDYGDTLSKDDFKVAVGKYYNKCDDEREKYAQYSDAARIVVHQGYKASSRRYIADIALIITKDLFVLNNAVQPICYADVNNIHLHARDIGVVAGWGVKEDGEPSDELRTLQIPYKYPETCSSELPPDWALKYHMQDKICAGFVNKSISVCKGDSGNGLFFKNLEDNRYYIHGLVSLGPSNNTYCNIQQNSLYTKVAYYYEFVDREVGKHYVEQCTLPPYPENGKWVIKNQAKHPGDLVTSNTVLRVVCNQGFELSSGSAYIDCESAYNMPSCESLCPKLRFPPGTDFKCTNKRGDEINCARASEGTVLTYSCPKGYKVPDGDKNIRYCRFGTWGRHKPRCVLDGTTDTSVYLEEEIYSNASTKVICTYDSWESYHGIEPENFNASLCTHVIYAYIGLWDNGNVRVQDDPLDLDDFERRGLYRRVTDMKKQNPDLKVLLSVGGARTSNASLFSIMAADPSKRPAFYGSTAYFLDTYNFDGFDIEWLSPTKNEETTYETLLRELRTFFTEKKRNWLLTATVPFDPSSKGFNTHAMNELLDWVNVKTYDMYEPLSSSVTGHHSALYASSIEGKWEKEHLNIDAAARNWLVLGMSRRKIALSIAFYGRSFTLLDTTKHDLHAPAVGPGPGREAGFLRYSEICKRYLSNWKSVWDDEQKVPYMYYRNKWFGYDDKESVKIKAAYIREKSFFGIHIWPVDGDDVLGKCGKKQLLLKQVNEAIGNPPNWDN